MSFDKFTLHGQTENGVRDFECTPDNTELYLHRQEFREVDHIFHRFDDVDRRLGAFVWRHVLGEEQFNYYTSLMWESQNWTIIFRPEPTDGDMQNFAHEQLEIPDTIEGLED
jgi:hypothetical protein